MRLIDVDALKTYIDTQEGRIFTGCTVGEALKIMVDEQPTVQPEIIQCKDCDWWTKQKDNVRGRCELMQMYPTGQWYCGNARRRPENETD